jgi:WhiB family redox-sensing transcriptional regulator
MSDDEWMALGRCRDVAPETFFPTSARGVAQARRVCELCSVAEECLAYALVHGIDHGMWGGKSERERRRLRASWRNPSPVVLAHVARSFA